MLLGGIVAGCCGLLFIAVSEYFFFEEFDARFNLVAVDYLVYPTESSADIWEEYPVVRCWHWRSALGTGLLALP